MCINHKEAGHYKCCCCFPLGCGVAILAVVEAIVLAFNSYFVDIYGILTSSLILIGFIAACCDRDNFMVRRGLFLVYAICLACFVIYLIVWACTTNIDTFVFELCS